ncbi:MAG: PD-(D/E)XK nuclease family protein [Planctomycetes bacterium]|nr:PD-(D/E)XK nuclease family protein [Planctomycetota bacterium]
MAVTFILGRAGTGKTRHCLDALLAELQKPDESRRLLLLVPEQASFQMERALAVRARGHGYWRAEVLSFSRLARRVFEDVGREPEMLRPTARALALRCVVEDDKEALSAFGLAARTVGFFVQLDRLIEELMAENVSPEDVSRAEARIDDSAARRRVAAVARVYEGYLGWLGSERIDPAQRLAALRERLTRSVWLRDAAVWVDGFAGFTGQELETLVALSREACDLAITLLLDPAGQAVGNIRRPPELLNLFHRTETTYQRLTQRLTDEGVELRPPIVLQPSVVPRFTHTPDLARLEAGLATPIAAITSLCRDGGVFSAPAIRVLECETHRDELLAAAAFIREQVRQSQGTLRFRDFALIARDLVPFAPVVADVFAEYELPYFLDRRRPLSVHALARFVQSLLESVATDFSTAATARLLRCGLLPLSREQSETLENEIVANEVRGFEVWCRQRWQFERGPELPSSAAVALDAARLLIAETLKPLVRLAREEDPPTSRAWARALYAALVALQVPERLTSWITQARETGDLETAEMHRLAWDGLCELLEDLHDLLGERPLGLPDITAVVSATLSELSVGLAPPTLDQVLVGSIERSRHPDLKYAWVLAFNDGIFPARPSEDALLSTTDRELLTEAGLSAPRPRRDDVFAERLLAYIALTRPSHGLTISYATVGDDGEPRVASPLLSELQRVLPDVEVEQARDDEPPVCLSEVAWGCLRACSNEPGESTRRRRYERLREELAASTELQARLDHLLRGLKYKNVPAPVVGYAGGTDATAGVAWEGSPTELDKYLQCPFRHFAEFGLRLSGRRGPAPAALELGGQAHDILRDVTEQAIAGDQPVGTLSDRQWLEFLDGAIRRFAAKQPKDLAARRPQAAFLSTALRPFLTELVLAHAQRWRRGGFEPLACERRFERGKQSALDALELTTADGQRVRLHGVIDRIDRCEHEGRRFLLIYDYKSTPKNVDAAYLTQDRLQLFTYLLAAEQAFATERNAQVAGVLLAPLYPDVTMTGRKYFAGAPPADARMYLYRPRGLFDIDVARLLDRQLDNGPSPVAMMQLKKDGGFYATSDVRGASDLAARLDLAKRTILHAADGITAGRIDVTPLVENKTLACRTCEFATLCRFEPVFNQPRAPEKSLPVLGQVAADGSGGAS